MKKMVSVIVLVAALIVPVASVGAQESARLYVTGADAPYTTGDVIEIPVLVDTAGAEINVVEFGITYPEETLRFESFDSTDSAFEIEPPGSVGSDGVIYMARAGVEPQNADDVLVTVIQFTALTSDPAELVISSGSKVLVAAESTNIADESASIAYTIDDSGTVSEPEERAPAPLPASSQQPAIQNTPATPTTPEESNQQQTDTEPTTTTTNTQDDADDKGDDESSVKGSALIAGLIAAGGLGLVVFGYLFRRHASKKSLIPTHAGKDGSMTSSVTPDHLTSPTQKPEKEGIDSLLKEVHGADVKSAEVVQTAKNKTRTK